MSQVIMVACDLHEKTMVLRIAQGRGRPESCKLANTPANRLALFARLHERSQAAGGAPIVFAYEASSLGFGLYDELSNAGITCHVLAPTKMARSSQQKRNKTDDKDAEWILGILRGHVLAGNSLPQVWVPDRQTRDDRELVRARLDVGEKQAAVKTQIKGLLKRCHLERPATLGKGWTKKYWAWLRGLTSDPANLASGGRLALASLLRQLEFLEKEELQYDQRLLELAMSPRYVKPLYALQELVGVGSLTALVYLTEMGDLTRFQNRRQVAAFLGLAPSTHESGQRDDCKGHITCQGPSRVRRVLCQATWTRVRYDDAEQVAYQRIAAKNPKRKKVAVVASMRRLAIRMWHRASEAQVATSVPASWGRDQRPQFPPPDPHPLPSSLLFREKSQ